MALLDYRNSPIDDTGLSPAQMLFGRRLKTKLPMATYTDNIKNSLKHRQSKQKFFHDKHALKYDLKPLHAGENVVMRHENKWKHGTIERTHETPRSYVIQTPDGRKYRRNRKHIRPTNSVPKHQVTEEIFTPALRYNYSDQQQSTSQSVQRKNNQSTEIPSQNNQKGKILLEMSLRNHRMKQDKEE